MRRLSAYRHHYGEASQFNMTPLIDVTVLLMSFFIMAGTFAALDAIELTVPTVHGDRPVEVFHQGDRLVINVPPMSAGANRAGLLPVQAQAFIINGQAFSPADTPSLVDHLKREREKYGSPDGAATEKLQVEVRADKQIDFSEVAPILSAVGQAGFAKVNYVAYGSGEGQ